MREAKLEEEAEQRRKERLKSEFFRRILNEQVQRARVVNAVREAKAQRLQQEEAELKRDREVAKQEMKLMFAEDIRYHFVLEKQRRRNSTHVKSGAIARDRPPSAALGRTPRREVEGISYLAEDKEGDRDGSRTATEAEGEAIAAKKPRIPRAPIVHKKPVEVTDEERELQQLEKEFREREKAQQLVRI